MNAVAIQYIWEAIQESERSDDLPFVDAVTRATRQRPDRSGALGRESITAAATEPHRVNGDSRATVTLSP